MGAEAEVSALAGPGTRVRRLSGAMVRPGLIDSPVHALWGTKRALFVARVPPGAGVPALFAAVAAKRDAMLAR